LPQVVVVANRGIVYVHDGREREDREPVHRDETYVPLLDKRLRDERYDRLEKGRKGRMDP
jgi:hypothetical protein